MSSRPASSRLRRALRAVLVPLWLGALASPLACAKGPEPTPVVAEDLSPVKAPEGLLAELSIPMPESTWARARAIVGGPAAFMPQSFGGLATTLLKLPITVSSEIDDKLPVLGAIVKKPTESYAVAIGVHVKAGDRFVDQLTKGPEARFVEKRDELSRVRVIAPKDAPSAPAAFVVGVLGNYLLVAQTAADLHALGPYVARTLPTRPVPKEDAVLDVPEAALSGPIAEAVKKQWSAARQGLEAASPTSFPFTGTVDTVLSVLTDARHARVALELGEETVKTRFVLDPKPGEGPAGKALAAMTVGDASPLLDLPASALIALTFRDSVSARTAAIPAQTEAVARLLGQELSAADRASISAAFEAETVARGDWVALGIALDPTGPSAMVRTPIADQAKMSKALEQLLDLAKLPSAKARLAEAQIALSAGKTVVENLPGDVRRLRFERLDKKDGGKGSSAKDDKDRKADKGKKDDKDRKAPEIAAQGSPIPTAIDLLYLVTETMVLGAVGYESREALRALAKSTPETSLGSNAAIKSAVLGAGNESSFVLVVDPIRVVAARAGKPAPATPAPALLAIGKTGTPPSLTGKLDIATFAIQELVKHRGAF
jgi:hypothetical protein